MKMEISDNINKIKNKYKIKINDGYSQFFNEVNFLRFNRVIQTLDLKSKINSMKKKIEIDKRIYGKLNEKKKTLVEKIEEEYIKIITEAKATYEFSDQLMRKLDEDIRRNIDKNMAQKIYRDLANDVMESTINKYVKYEKMLIILVDKYNDLTCL